MRIVLKSGYDIVKEAINLLEEADDYNSSQRVREILRVLYSGCCAYCECAPEDGSYFHIEHFYPKDEALGYSAYIKAFENLHYSCQRCNNIKSNRDSEYIFSPNFYLDEELNWVHANADKIEKELFYLGHLLFSKNLNPGSTDRGAETIKFFNLNNQNTTGKGRREALVESRLRHFAFVTRVVEVTFHLLTRYNKHNNKAIDILLRVLIQTINRDRPYSTMVIHNYGETMMQLITIFKRKSKLPI